MLKLKLQSGFEMPYESAVEAEDFVGGTNRRTLTITAAAAAAPLNVLEQQLNEQNLATITLENTEKAITNSLAGFVLRHEFGLKNFAAQRESELAPAVYEDKIVIVLGKRTYIEAELKRQGF